MNMKYFLFVLLLSLSLIPGCTKSCAKPGEKDQVSASVFFESPANNQSLTSPIEVKFGLNGMTIRPAMEELEDKTSGHHHILIDHPAGFIEEGQAVPADDSHIHYGKGETSAFVNLSPGVHTLSMQFADGAHRSYGKKMAATITVTVVEDNKPQD